VTSRPSGRQWRPRAPALLRRPPPVLTRPPNQASVPTSRAEQWREAIRQVGRHRQWAAAGCLGIAVAVGVATFAPRPPASVPVVTAARDLASGVMLTAADVATERVTSAQLPAGALADAGLAIGRRLAGAVRRGEPLTDVRLESAAGVLANPGHGLVATPIRLADTRAADLLQPGMTIDVLAASVGSILGGAGGAGGAASTTLAAAVVVARGVTIIDVPQTADPTGAGGGSATDPLDQDGALVVLATTPEQARVLAQAQVSDRLSAISAG
jgi:pilus assembly protein CpaB